MTHRDRPRFLDLRDGGNLPQHQRAVRDQIAAVLIAAIVLVVAVCAGGKAIPQAAYDAASYEVIR